MDASEIILWKNKKVKPKFLVKNSLPINIHLTFIDPDNDKIYRFL